MSVPSPFPFLSKDVANTHTKPQPQGYLNHPFAYMQHGTLGQAHSPFKTYGGLTKPAPRVGEPAWPEQRIPSIFQKDYKFSPAGALPYQSGIPGAVHSASRESGYSPKESLALKSYAADSFLRSQAGTSAHGGTILSPVTRGPYLQSSTNRPRQGNYPQPAFQISDPKLNRKTALVAGQSDVSITNRSALGTGQEINSDGQENSSKDVWTTLAQDFDSIRPFKDLRSKVQGKKEPKPEIETHLPTSHERLVGYSRNPVRGRVTSSTKDYFEEPEVESLPKSLLSEQREQPALRKGSSALHQMRMSQSYRGSLGESFSKKGFEESSGYNPTSDRPISERRRNPPELWEDPSYSDTHIFKGYPDESPEHSPPNRVDHYERAHETLVGQRVDTREESPPFSRTQNTHCSEDPKTLYDLYNPEQLKTYDRSPPPRQLFDESVRQHPLDGGIKGRRDRNSNNLRVISEAYSVDASVDLQSVSHRPRDMFRDRSVYAASEMPDNRSFSGLPGGGSYTRYLASKLEGVRSENLGLIKERDHYQSTYKLQTERLEDAERRSAEFAQQLRGLSLKYEDAQNDIFERDRQIEKCQYQISVLKEQYSELINTYRPFMSSGMEPVPFSPKTPLGVRSYMDHQPHQSNVPLTAGPHPRSEGRRNWREGQDDGLLAARFVSEELSSDMGMREEHQKRVPFVDNGKQAECNFYAIHTPTTSDMLDSRSGSNLKQLKSPATSTAKMSHPSASPHASTSLYRADNSFNCETTLQTKSGLTVVSGGQETLGADCSQTEDVPNRNRQSLESQFDQLKIRTRRSDSENLLQNSPVCANTGTKQQTSNITGGAKQKADSSPMSSDKEVVENTEGFCALEAFPSKQMSLSLQAAHTFDESFDLFLDQHAQEGIDTEPK